MEICYGVRQAGWQVVKHFELEDTDDYTTTYTLVIVGKNHCRPNFGGRKRARI